MTKIVNPHKLRMLQGYGGPRSRTTNERQELEIFDPKRVYDCRSVAQRLRQSVSSIREKVFLGQIPYFKAGEGRNAPVRFLGQALNRWLEGINRNREVDQKQEKKAPTRKTRRGVKEFENFVENLERRN